MPNQMPPLQSLEGPGVGQEEYDISKMSEDELAQLVQLGVIDENMAENARQMKLAEQLRYQGMPEGRNSGRIYTAANPLEFLGTGLQQYQAMKRQKELEKQRGEMQGKQTQARGTYWDLLRGQRQKPQDFGWIEPPKLDL